MVREYGVRASKAYFENRFLYQNDDQKDMMKISGNKFNFVLHCHGRLDAYWSLSKVDHEAKFDRQLE
jgi:hypothetical protein